VEFVVVVFACCQRKNIERMHINFDEASHFSIGVLNSMSGWFDEIVFMSIKM